MYTFSWFSSFSYLSLLFWSLEGRIIHRYILHTEAKIRNLSKNSHILKSQFRQNWHLEILVFHKIHIFKISFFTKFTFSNSHFSNSHFPQNSYFWTIFFIKFTFFKHQMSLLKTLSKNSHFHTSQVPPGTTDFIMSENWNTSTFYTK